jgi:phosphoadenosine phosphosulfate reductase
MLSGDAPSLLLSCSRLRLLPRGNWAGSRVGLTTENPSSTPATLARARVFVSTHHRYPNAGPGVPPISTDLAVAVGHANQSIQRTVDRFPGRTTLSCSFGGPSGMVLLDLALQVEPCLNVFVLDTELLFPETYALIERVERRYGISVERVRPVQSVAAQAVTHGDSLWLRNPDACCDLRKVEPLQRHLQSFDAWLTAVRRDQSPTRAELPLQEWDERNEVVKVAPLAEWSEDDVWAYVQEHDVPVNTLHFDGFPSIGCTHCTRRVVAGEGARAGRWAGFGKLECGIHVA